MSLSEHKNPGPGRTASAPYNFVPLPEIVVKAVNNAKDLPDHDRYCADRHTGYFEVILTTKSPLYVRCPLTLPEFLRQERQEDQNDSFHKQVKNTPHFFYTRYPADPVIPGSSLRGMLRGVLEIVSYGKIQWVTDKRLFFRTVGSDSLGDTYGKRMSEGTGSSTDGFRSRAEAGFLRRRTDGRWQIEKCQVARAKMETVAEKFGLPQQYNLCSGTRPSDTPLWEFQHRDVWVQAEPTPTEHRSSGRFLRYREVMSLELRNTANHTKGTLVVTGPMQSKKRAFVFIPDSQPEIVDVPNDPTEESLNRRLIDRFHDDDQITQWQRGAFPRNKPFLDCRVRDGYLRDGEPVFFLRENGQLSFLGRAQMFRLPYNKTPRNLVPTELRNAAIVDYADALFGYAKPKKKHQGDTEGVNAQQGEKARAYASRVFVTDATLVQGQTDIWFPNDPIFVPKILATPKPTAFQHYLTQQESDDKNKLDHYDSPPFHETTIRGHKRYWHQGLGNGLSLDEIRERIEEERNTLQRITEQEAQGKPDTQHTQFKPVKPEVNFTFRVYFENLSAGELGALCWVLHPLGDPTKTYCHSLGMGKPLGMGVVQLSVTLHLTNRFERYASLFDGQNWQTGVETGQALADRITLERLVQPFEVHLLSILTPDAPRTHLFELRRIAMLLKTLELDGFLPELPATPGNRFLTSQNRPNTRYMTVQLPNTPVDQRNEYRERPVLPTPEAFGNLTGHVAVVLPPPEDPVQVRARVKGLRSKGEVSRMKDIVPQIARIADDIARHECAELLKKWLLKENLWNQKPHASADWHKQLNLLLSEGNI